MKITKNRLKEIIREEIQMLNEADIPTFLTSFGFKRTGFDNGVMFFIHKGKKLDAWHDMKSMNTMVGKGSRDNKVFKGNQEKELSKYLQKKFKLKSSEPQWMYEGKLNEGGKLVQLQIPIRDKIKVDKILKKLKLKIGKQYDIGVGKSGTFVLELDRKFQDKVLELLMVNRIQVKEL